MTTGPPARAVPHTPPRWSLRRRTLPSRTPRRDARPIENQPPSRQRRPQERNAGRSDDAAGAQPLPVWPPRAPGRLLGRLPGRVPLLRRNAAGALVRCLARRLRPVPGLHAWQGASVACRRRALPGASALGRRVRPRPAGGMPDGRGSIVTGPILDAACEALLAGLSVVPPAEDGSKRPMGGWKHYQRERPTPEDLQQWYGGHSPRRGIGLVCGAVSGGLELLEFENAEAYAEFVAAATDAGLGELVERTEGGYVVCAPSAGKVHPSGRPYQLLQGGFSAIARISASERAELFRLAQTFDRMPQPQWDAAGGQRDQVGREPGGRPGDDLERRVPWAKILAPHGWRMLYRRGGLEAWQRPGKRTPGISATIGHARGEHGEPRLYVFSTSTPFESERSYTKLGALAVLEHGGDYQAAAKALRAKGYGGRPPHAPPDVPPPRPVRDRRAGHNRQSPANSGSGQGHLAPGEESAAGNPPEGSRYGIAHGSPDPRLWAEQPPEGPSGCVWPLTDWGNAQRLVFYWGNALRYCHVWRKWLVWDGCRWCVEDNASATRLAKDTARRIFHEAAEVAPTDDSPAAERQAEARRKAILAWAFKTQGGGRLRAMLELAASEPGVPVLPTDLDRDPWALNVRNGTVDLRTGRLRPHRRADLLTKLAPVDFDPDAPCPTWAKFLARVMNQDAELIGFLRRAVGYSCTGAVSA